MEIKLPISPRKAKSVNPQSLAVIAPHKTGKTTIMAGLTTEFALGESIVLNLEPTGYDFVDATVIDIKSYKHLIATLDAIKAANTEKFTYKYVIIDNVTKIDEWAEVRGTLNYMNSVQGKKFNREGDIPNGKKIMPSNPKFNSVHSVGEGFGYRWSRQVMVDLFDNYFSKIAPHVILVGHTKDKVKTNKLGETVDTSTIALTGRLAEIYARRVDSICQMVREGTKGYLSFKSLEDSDDNTETGSRSKHLHGRILISEFDKENNEVNTFWNNIFI